MAQFRYSKDVDTANLQAIRRHTMWADGCLESTCARDKDGYGRVRVVGKSHRMPRLAWQVLVGPIPNGLNVLHNCHNRLCCNPNHLRLGTQSENVLDTVEQRTHHNLVRTDLLVQTAKNLRAEGWTYRKVGINIGVDHKTVWNWINR